MTLERPHLADRPPPRPSTPRQPPSDFRRRLSYYLTGVALGVILVIPIVSARCSAQRGAATAPGGPVQRIP